jgi:hypothetical protein
MRVVLEEWIGRVSRKQTPRAAKSAAPTLLRDDANAPYSLTRRNRGKRGIPELVKPL